MNEDDVPAFIVGRTFGIFKSKGICISLTIRSTNRIISRSTVTSAHCTRPRASRAEAEIAILVTLCHLFGTQLSGKCIKFPPLKNSIEKSFMNHMKQKSVFTSFKKWSASYHSITYISLEVQIFKCPSECTHECPFSSHKCPKECTSTSGSYLGIRS